MRKYSDIGVVPCAGHRAHKVDCTLYIVPINVGKDRYLFIHAQKLCEMSNVYAGLLMVAKCHPRCAKS